MLSTEDADAEHAKAKRDSHREKANRDGRQPAMPTEGLYSETAASRAAFPGGDRAHHAGAERDAGYGRGAIEDRTLRAGKQRGNGNPRTISTPDVTHNTTPPQNFTMSTPQPNQMAMPSQPMMVSMTSDGQVMMQSLIPVLTSEGQMMMLNGNQMFPMMMSGYNVSADRGAEA